MRDSISRSVASVSEESQGSGFHPLPTRGLKSHTFAMHHLVSLGLLTSLFVIALLFTGFLREMAHPAIGMDPVKFIVRENATYWRMVGIETAAYVAACAFVISLLRRI